MIYDAETHELWTNEGNLLKTLDCPLHKLWSELVVVPNPAMRHCTSCHKTVVNLAEKTEAEVEELLTRFPDCCVYVAPKSPTVRIKNRWGLEREDPCPIRRIRTAWGEEAINAAATAGYWPLVKRVERAPKIRARLHVHQNRKTGEVQTTGHRGWPSGPGWKQVLTPFDIYPHSAQHQIAAYLLPKDIKVEEKVFLLDLIEDLVGSYIAGPGPTRRLEAAYAVWNGTDFEIQWDEARDARGYLG